MATITASHPTATSINVTWTGVTAEDKPGATYSFVRVDEYQAATISNLKPGDPLPTAEQTQGGTNKPDSPGLSAADNTVTVFNKLNPSTSYVFVLYGFADIGSGNAPQPGRLAFSAPVSTTAKASPTPPSGTPNYPELSTQNYPQTLQNQNHIVVSCANEASFDHWNVIVDGVQEPQDLSGSNTYTIWSTPSQKYVISAIGLLHDQGDYARSPNVPIAAGPNSNSVRTFLSNSGVDGTNGIQTFVKSSHSTSIRNMLGL